MTEGKGLHFPDPDRIERNKLFRWLAIAATVIAVVSALYGALAWYRGRLGPFDGKIIDVKERAKPRLTRRDPFAKTYVLNLGMNDEVVIGELFEVPASRRPLHKARNPKTPYDSKALLLVSTVYPASSDCVLESYAYDQDLFGPKKGDGVLRLGPLESKVYAELKSLEKLLHSATDAYSDYDQESQEKALQDFLRKVEAFLSRNLDSRWRLSALQDRARALALLGEFDLSLSAYDKIEREYPSQREWVEERSNEVKLRKRYHENPEDQVALFMLAELDLKSGRFEESVAKFLTLQELNPEYPGVSNRIAIAIYNMRDMYVFLANEALEIGRPYWAKRVLEKVQRYVSDDEEVSKLIKKADKQILIGGSPDKMPNH